MDKQPWIGALDYLRNAAIGAFGKGPGRHRRGGTGAPSMTHAAYPALASRRRRWPLFLIVAVVVGLAAGWTGLWF